MQRDVKIGLVVGVILVAIVAVVFFRRDEVEGDRFRKLVPGQEPVASKPRVAPVPSRSDPYPVPPEYLGRPWQAQAAGKTAPSSAPSRGATGRGEPQKLKEAAKPERTTVILRPPEYAPSPAGKGGRAEPVRNAAKPAPTDAAIRGAAPREYTIQEYDTLSDIASRLLGDASLYPLIYGANHDLLGDPNHLPVGQKIRIPDAHRAPGAEAATNLPQRRRPRERVYEVREHDSLRKIARTVYGPERESMYRAIFEANRHQLASPDDLRVGMPLRLPD